MAKHSKFKPKPPRWRTIVAILLILLSSVFNAIGNYMMKTTLTVFEGGLFTSQFVRHSTSACFLYALCKTRNVEPFQISSRTKLRVVIVRGIIGMGVSISSGSALSLIHVTDFASIFKIYPAHVLILSWLFFGEIFTVTKVLCIVIGYTGVLFIVRPAFLFGALEEDTTGITFEQHLVGTLFAFGGSIAQALIMLQIRVSKRHNIHSMQL